MSALVTHGWIPSYGFALPQRSCFTQGMAPLGKLTSSDSSTPWSRGLAWPRSGGSSEARSQFQAPSIDWGWRSSGIVSQHPPSPILLLLVPQRCGPEHTSHTPFANKMATRESVSRERGL